MIRHEIYDEHVNYNLLSRSVHVSRVERTCRLCGKIIQKGEQYRKMVEKIDDDFISSNYHTYLCIDISN